MMMLQIAEINDNKPITPIKNKPPASSIIILLVLVLILIASYYPCRRRILKLDAIISRMGRTFWNILFFMDGVPISKNR